MPQLNLTAFGKQLVLSTDAASARTVLGLGSADNPTFASLFIGGSDAKIARGATGPTIDSQAAGGFRSLTLDGSADAPISGSSGTFSGDIIQSTGGFLHRLNGNNSALSIVGAADINNGASIQLRGNSIGSNNGTVIFRRGTGSSTVDTLTINGTTSAATFASSATVGNDGSSVSLYLGGAIRKTTGILYIDVPDTIGDIRMRVGSSYTERFRVSSSGVSVTGSANASGIMTAEDQFRVGTAVTTAPFMFAFDGTTYSVQNNAGRGLTLWSNTIAAGSVAFAISGNAQGATSGQNSHLWVARTFNPSSGTGTWNGARFTQTINQTGGANGITRGVLVDSVLTAAADHRAVEIADMGSHYSIKTGTGKVELGGSLTWTPPSSITPTINGQLTVEATSNTTVTIKLKGSDGVVRSGTITLT